MSYCKGKGRKRKETEGKGRKQKEGNGKRKRKRKEKEQRKHLCTGVKTLYSENGWPGNGEKKGTILQVQEEVQNPFYHVIHLSFKPC